MKKNLLNKKGFTLIELIVVIAILAILALILVPSLMGYIEKANISKNEANARTIYSELALKNAEKDYTFDKTDHPKLQGSNPECVVLPSSATSMATITAIQCGSGAGMGTFTP